MYCPTEVRHVIPRECSIKRRSNQTHFLELYGAIRRACKPLDPGPVYKANGSGRASCTPQPYNVPHRCTSHRRSSFSGAVICDAGPVINVNGSERASRTPHPHKVPLHNVPRDMTQQLLNSSLRLATRPRLASDAHPHEQNTATGGARTTNELRVRGPYEWITLRANPINRTYEHLA